MTDSYDDYEVDDGMAPEGPVIELLHIAMTGHWGMTIKDALELRRIMDDETPPEGGDDSAWQREVEDMRDDLFDSKVYDTVRRIAWAAYRQGIFHGELLSLQK
jgi:hypothetical protein